MIDTCSFIGLKIYAITMNLYVSVNNKYKVNEKASNLKWCVIHMIRMNFLLLKDNAA